MNFLPFFFIAARMFHFLHDRETSYLLQKFSRMLEERRAHPERKHILIIDASASLFIFYFILNLCFLLYCIWLMFDDNTWNQGCLLLFIASQEYLATHGRINGAYFTDSEGFGYPRNWLRYLTLVETLYILLKLFKS